MIVRLLVVFVFPRMRPRRAVPKCDSSMSQPFKLMPCGPLKTRKGYDTGFPHLHTLTDETFSLN